MNNVAIIVIVGAILLLFFAGIRIVRPTHRGLVERLGKLLHRVENIFVVIHRIAWNRECGDIRSRYATIFCGRGEFYEVAWVGSLDVLAVEIQFRARIFQERLKRSPQVAPVREHAGV